jgi:diketogulonate reductase-like aldo/keto reductase
MLLGPLDTAQAYQNETEAGIAIRDSGLNRDQIYVTTKYSALGGLDIQTSIHNSLKNVSIVATTHNVSRSYDAGCAAGCVVR